MAQRASVRTVLRCVETVVTPSKLCATDALFPLDVYVIAELCVARHVVMVVGPWLSVFVVSWWLHPDERFVNQRGGGGGSTVLPSW